MLFLTIFGYKSNSVNIFTNISKVTLYLFILLVKEIKYILIIV